VLATPPEPTSGKCLTVGFVGRLVHQKGVDLLLQALARARGRGLPLRAVIVGGGPEEPALRALAHALGLDDAVEWVGPVRPEEVAAHMGRLDVLVLPSRTVPTWKEQFGRVLIEAMALGVAVVGSDCGAIPEVIGRPDLIFPEWDAEALAGLLERLATDPAWRAEVRAYGLDRVRENFTMEAVARKLVSLWEEVLEAPEGG
jgi:glycosyltransferase involved in cell wall biosynthesis